MKKDEPYLRHILDAISDIEKFTKDISKDSFLQNREKQYAVIRAMEIIGEAAKNVSPRLRTKYPQIPWKTAAGMRDKLIHGYFGVNLERVWQVIVDNLPDFKNQIRTILEHIDNP
jgi:uncharacterized protein with HEPN domain